MQGINREGGFLEKKVWDAYWRGLWKDKEMRKGTGQERGPSSWGPCFADLYSTPSPRWFKEGSKVKPLVLLFESFLALQWKDMDVQVDGLEKMGKVEGPKVRRDVCFLSPGSHGYRAGRALVLVPVGHQPSHLRVPVVVDQQWLRQFPEHRRQ